MKVIGWILAVMLAVAAFMLNKDGTEKYDVRKSEHDKTLTERKETMAINNEEMVIKIEALEDDLEITSEDVKILAKKIRRLTDKKDKLGLSIKKKNQSISQYQAKTEMAKREESELKRKTDTVQVAVEKLADEVATVEAYVTSLEKRKLW